MREKILVTNLKSKDNIHMAVSEVKPDKMVIISSRKAKFSDFEVKTKYIKIKNQFEDIIHKINGVLDANNDFSIVAKPDKIGMYLLWLAQMHLINPVYLISHGELQQIPVVQSSKLSDKEGEILKLADCHGFIDPKSINKEFGIAEDNAKEYLEKFSKMGILKYFETKEFKVGEEKAHAYYSTDLIEKGKEIEDMYLLTETGKMALYLILTSEE